MVPTIEVKSPGATFKIEFDRTADACWIVIWPSFSDLEPTSYRGLSYAMEAIADFIGRTEF